MKPIERRDIALHIFRIAVAMVALGGASRSLGMALVGSLALFFAAFSLTHDLAHGALGLPRRVNEVALCVSGLLMLMSGHAMRIMHLRHHARRADDIEGTGAHLTAWRALFVGPRNALALRRGAFRIAHGLPLRWQIGETSMNVAAVVLAMGTGSRVLLVHVAVATVLQCTLSFWGAYLPHNVPSWLVALARPFAFTHSPTILNLICHDVHHEYPKIPCQQLVSR
ncbi:fatty acid desaturase [Pendulispora rubella]|uniref:Fatty acid desaturase n=1 Tax=Pendulispora rubella TaxID=2741070 RepID=A0ABZ2KVL9_9BACT